MHKFSMSLHADFPFRARFRSALVLLSGALLLSGVASAQPAATTKAATASAPAPTAAPQAAAPAPTAAPTTTAAPAATTADTTPEAGAATEEQREDARLAFEAGTTAFEAKDYTTALGEFRRAQAVIPSPHAEYWVAKSLDLSDPEHKDAALSLQAYTRLLTNPGASHIGADKISEVQKRVQELKKLVPARVKLVTVPEGATVSVDGNVLQAKTPLELELIHGIHKVQVALVGYETVELEMSADGGSTVEETVELSMKAPPAPIAAAPVLAAEQEEKSMMPAIVTLSLSGIGLVTGTIFGVMALNSKSKFNDNPNTDDADAAERNALIADMSLGIAVTLGITGAVLLTSSDEDAVGPTASLDEARKKHRAKPANKQLVVAPYAHRHGGGASARFSF